MSRARSSPTVATPGRLRIGSLAAGGVGLGLLVAGCGVPSGVERSGDWDEPDPGLFATGPYILLGPNGTAYVALKADGIPAPTVEWWIEKDGGDDAAGPTSSADTAVATPDLFAATPPTAQDQPRPQAAGQIRTATARRSDDVWVTELRGLPSGPDIHYRVKSALGTTPDHKFRTGAAKGKRFRFAVFGDTRSGHTVHRSIIEAIEREHVDFTIHTGDMVERGGRQEQWTRFFQIERPLMAEVPMMPLVGNHDVSGRDYFRRYFLHALWSNNEHYFVRDWGNLRVVGVDSGIECREGCSQYYFAERALAEGERRGQLMVMAMHYPPYSSGEHGSSSDVQGPVSALARRHGVELVVAGHDHDYERTKPIDGTTYLVSGSSGAPIRPVRPRWFTAEARTEPHYVLIDVEPERLILRAVNLAGDTFDTTVIDANPPRP
ncbi:MAG TPA: metallophosphoesterase [Kofleriaceae bacterium]|nr:metallophosphoesterase [Kofleriaceae bacterium]